ncbi:MAG TPA: SLC13 family permease [Chitinophagaceae bacterium]|jgi:GntP family gluconate:H+ symporter|nr:SLC13 family permease [Chitinophagaceae bacterium]
MTPLILLLIGIVVVLGSILVIRLHAVLALLFGAFVVALLTPSSFLQRYALSNKFSESQLNALINQSAGERVAIGFGDTCAKIGLLIVLASIIGKCMMDSGAAERIVRTMLRISGEKKAPVAFTVSSFTLGIPIFFDTVFLLMVPLARVMGVRHPRSYALYVMAIIAGATITHSLVPPTPGPLFAARALNVSIGAMIIMGTVIGLACSTAGLLYAYWLNKRQNIPLRTTADISVEKLKEWSNKETKQLPSFFMSVLPILLPIILIAGQAIAKVMKDDLPGSINAFFKLTGDPTIALFIATIISLILVTQHHSNWLKEIQKSVEEAIYSAGTIILITASGGAFGAMLQQTSIGSWLAENIGQYKLAILPLAFFITAIIRTAQGSATVAMISAVGMLTAFNTPGALNFHPVYLAIVIGCGSKLFQWMNDSGFWVICKMSGFSEKETIRNSSFQMMIMGFVGLIVTMLLAKFIPFPL